MSARQRYERGQYTNESGRYIEVRQVEGRRYVNVRCNVVKKWSEIFPVCERPSELHVS